MPMKYEYTYTKYDTERWFLWEVTDDLKMSRIVNSYNIEDKKNGYLAWFKMWGDYFLPSHRGHVGKWITKEEAFLKCL